MSKLEIHHYTIRNETTRLNFPADVVFIGMHGRYIDESPGWIFELIVAHSGRDEHFPQNRVFYDIRIATVGDRFDPKIEAPLPNCAYTLRADNKGNGTRLFVALGKLVVDP